MEVKIKYNTYDSDIETVEIPLDMTNNSLFMNINTYIDTPKKKLELRMANNNSEDIEEANIPIEEENEDDEFEAIVEDKFSLEMSLDEVKEFSKILSQFLRQMH